MMMMITNYIISDCKIRRVSNHCSVVKNPKLLSKCCRIKFCTLFKTDLLLGSSEEEINWMCFRVNYSILTSLTLNPGQTNNWITISKRSKW